MFCDFHNLANRHFIFCILGFLGSTANSIGLCMSSYSLSKYRDKGFDIEQYIVVGCISTAIITSAIKDNLISNPDLLKKNTNEENNKNFIDI